MNEFYQILTGPMVWLSLGVFFLGLMYRLVSMYLLARKNDRLIFSYMSFKYGFRSIAHWLVPFGTRSMRKNPLMTIVMFSFHVCVIVTPLTVMAHGMLIEESTGLGWISIPDRAADIMTVVVLFACVFFLVRRLSVKEVRFVTTKADFLLLALVVLPFATGFVAYHQWFSYRLFMILHILSAEILLVAIPFTRLGHIVFAPFTRAYAGSEFGGVRHSRDW